MQPLRCGVLPHVTVSTSIAFGQADIWPNTSSEWIKRFSADNTRFMEMYRQRDGSPAGHRTSIISTRVDSTSDLTFLALRDHVVALSTLYWLTDYTRSSADSWIADWWSLPPSSGTYVRRGKFVQSYFGDPKAFPIYPQPLTTNITLTNPAGHMQRIANRLIRELHEPREKSLLQAITYLHLARHQLPFYTSPGQDVETLWSGLENLCHVPVSPTRPGPNRPPAVARWLPSRFRPYFARRLGWTSPISKGQFISDQLTREFSTNPHIDGAILKELDIAILELYNLRNRYTHGSGIDDQQVHLASSGIDAFTFGLRLSKAVLLSRMAPPDEVICRRAMEDLNATFLWEGSFRELLKILEDSKTQDWIPTPKFSTEKLKKFHLLLQDIAKYRRVMMTVASRNKIKQASRKMVVVLSTWVKALNSSPPPGVDLGPVRWVHDRITQLLNDNRDDEIDQDVTGSLVYERADIPQSYAVEGSPPPALTIGGVIPIWDWIGAFIDLNNIAS